MLIDKIQPARLADYFTTLCEIDSPGLEEKPVADYLKQFFAQFPEILVEEDNSAGNTGSNSGNIIVTIPGNQGSATGLFFNCHMDVIRPCCGVQVEYQDGVFRSGGDTVLGGDDKAGIAILMELTHLLMEEDASFPLVQFILTTGEEIGLLGAVHLDFGLIRAEYGYALDSTGVDNAVIGAPAAVHFEAVITGRAAHAGLNPEDGINAIFLGSEVISHLSLGRIDEETTANIGFIEGGTATNIIPEEVRVKGEIRSHSEEKLEQVVMVFQKTFENICVSYGGRADVSFSPQYASMRIAESSPVVQRVRKSGDLLGRNVELTVAGGGSDANIFNSRGLPTVILGTGMTDVHTTAENISLGDMVRTAELVLSLVTC
jgi:tripeptide aminopeptidase